MQASEQAIRQVVQEVLKKLGNPAPSRSEAASDWGVHATVDQAVDAAQAGFQQLSRATIEQRRIALDCVRQICERDAEELGRLEFEETQIGRLDHKIEKLQIIKLVPGVEFLKSDAYSGDRGLTVIEYAPFGVIGAITPVTHSLPTLAGNVINMVAAGNTLVVNPHPSGARIACEGVKRFNRAIYEATGLQNLINIIGQPTLESAQQIFDHRGIRVLVVTGGPAVARAALNSNKRAIVAGPGNPPVVVDESADLDRAADSVIRGAAYDNNLLCIGEKEIFVVESVFDRFMDAMSRHGGHRLSASEVDALTKHAFAPPKEPGGHAVLNRDLIGKDAAELAERSGASAPKSTQVIFGETDESNPYVVEEQMMPFLPIVRARSAEHAIELAETYEHGYGHTSLIHTSNVRHMTEMGRRLNTTLFIKNGPCMAGLGLGGEGYLSYSIATPTGEGVTNPLTFTRQRRCTLVDDLRIV